MQHVFKNSQILLDAISNVLREERLKSGKSARMLAYEYDLHVSMISRAENSKNDIKITSIYAMCEALNIPVDVFFNKVKNKLPQDFSLLDL